MGKQGIVGRRGYMNNMLGTPMKKCYVCMQGALHVENMYTHVHVEAVLTTLSHRRAGLL